MAKYSGTSGTSRKKFQETEEMKLRHEQHTLTDGTLLELHTTIANTVVYLKDGVEITREEYYRLLSGS